VGHNSNDLLIFWHISENTVYHAFDLSIELRSEGRRKESFYTLYFLCHLMCLCCKGVCTAVVHVEVGWLVWPVHIGVHTEKNTEGILFAII